MFANKEVLSFAKQLAEKKQVCHIPEVKYYYTSTTKYTRSFSHLYTQKNNVFSIMCKPGAQASMSARDFKKDTLGLLDLDPDLTCLNCLKQVSATYPTWSELFGSLFYWDALKNPSSSTLSSYDRVCNKHYAVKDALEVMFSLKELLPRLDAKALPFITNESLNVDFLAILSSMVSPDTKYPLDSMARIREGQLALDLVSSTAFTKDSAVPNFADSRYISNAFSSWQRAIWKYEDVSNFADELATDLFLDAEDDLSVNFLPKVPLLQMSSYPDLPTWATAEIKNQFLLFAKLAVTSWNKQLAACTERFKNKEVIVAWNLNAQRSSYWHEYDACLVPLHAVDFVWRNSTWVVFMLPASLSSDVSSFESMYILGEYSKPFTDALLETAVSLLSSISPVKALAAAELSLK